MAGTRATRMSDGFCKSGTHPTGFDDSLPPPQRGEVERRQAHQPLSAPRKQVLLVACVAGAEAPPSLSSPQGAEDALNLINRDVNAMSAMLRKID